MIIKNKKNNIEEKRNRKRRKKERKKHSTFMKVDLKNLSLCADKQKYFHFL